MEQGLIVDIRHRKKKKPELPTWSTKTSFSMERGSPLSISPYAGYIFILAYVLIAKLIVMHDNILPSQLLVEEENQNSGRFIGERAELFLKNLTDLGPRLRGSYENEVLAVNLFKDKISCIIEKASKTQKIEFDIQNASGSYLTTSDFRNHYENIKNIVVKIGSRKCTSSLLLNCHFDTVAESLGASDNGLNCAVLLEVFRVISKRKKPFKNNIIFLFNGAEETPLQGSHGFLKHKWSKDVKALINLDSAGAGGKEILFQVTGELWLLKAYAKAVLRPHGGVHAQEIFEYKIIPSDTDFRIFRDIGNFSGFDLAHAANGYVYHTRFDCIKFIKPGVYQNTGNHILNLVNELGDSPELGKNHEKVFLTFFDIFGLWFVVYSEHVAFFINLFTVILSITAVYRTMDMISVNVSSLGKAVGGQTLGLICSGFVVLVIAKVLDMSNSTMSWYLRPWLIFPLYCIPNYLVLVFMLLLMRSQMKDILPGRYVILFMNAAQLIWTTILLVGTVFGIRSTYIIMILVLFSSIGSLISTRSRQHFSVSGYLKTYTCFLIFPSLYMISQSMRIYSIIIPSGARMGAQKNPDFVIGGCTFLLNMIHFLQIIPIILLVRKLKYFIISLSVCFLVTIIAVTCTNLGFPYDGNPESPVLQRIYVFHTERIYYNQKNRVVRNDSGYFIQSLDRNGIHHALKSMPELKKAEISCGKCAYEMFCGFPVFSPRYIKSTPYSYFIPTNEQPKFSTPLIFKVVKKTRKGNVLKLNITIKGPEHMTVALSPMKNVELLAWSFDEFSPEKFELSHGRRTYLILHTRGLSGQLWFEVDLKVPQRKNSPFVNFAVAGHYMNEKQLRTEKFQNFLSSFPLWVHLAPWVTRYEQWAV